MSGETNLIDYYHFNKNEIENRKYKSAVYVVKVNIVSWNCLSDVYITYIFIVYAYITIRCETIYIYMYM